MWKTSGGREVLATRDFDSDCAGDLAGQKGATPPDVSHKIYTYIFWKRQWPGVGLGEPASQGSLATSHSC